MTEKQTEIESIQKSRLESTKRIVIRMDSSEYGYLKEIRNAVGEPVNKFILSAVRLRQILLLLEFEPLRNMILSPLDESTQN